MSSKLTSEWVIKTGKSFGFDRVGVAPAIPPSKLSKLPEWLAKGHGGTMAYLENPKRRDVRLLLPDARSVICCALGYDTSSAKSTMRAPDPSRGWISRYAWGGDYHAVVEQKLDALRHAIAERAGESFEAKLYVDTGPVVERVYAEQAGLGWQAKNTCLIDAEGGSYFFIGVLVTNLDLQPGTPPPDQCGACTLCIEACPTDALQPYVLNAQRCISYLTIELRESIPEFFREKMGDHIFGCDICQDVCPWNEKSPVPDRTEFRPRKSDASGMEFFQPLLEAIAGLSPEDFAHVFRGSAIRRTKWRGLMRNVIIAMGNSGKPLFRPILERFVRHDDLLLAVHSRWALSRISDTVARTETEGK